MRIIGIDMAVQDSKAGLCVARMDADRVTLDWADRGTANRRSLVDNLRQLLREADGPVLLAIDAPLGWPAALGAELQDHVAGGKLLTGRDEMFCRWTDRYVRSLTKRAPLEVGANLIARVAHRACEVLREVRTPAHPIPLAWQPEDAMAMTTAIEVYPGGLLLQMGVANTDVGEKSSYKKGTGFRARERVVEHLAREVDVSAVREALVGGADVLDAALCVLAGVDFLRGRCLDWRSVSGEGAPDDAAQRMALVRREGWIWVRHSMVPPLGT